MIHCGVNKGYGVRSAASSHAHCGLAGTGDGWPSRAERALLIARKVHLNEDRAGAAVRQVANRLDDLATDRQLLTRVAAWALTNWLFDAASLWVFLRAFGVSLDPDALIIAFGIVNVLQVIPITPGGLGIVEGAYALQLAAFGVPKTVATLGVATPHRHLAAHWWWCASPRLNRSASRRDKL